MQECAQLLLASTVAQRCAALLCPVCFVLVRRAALLNPKTLYCLAFPDLLCMCCYVPHWLLELSLR